MAEVYPKEAPAQVHEGAALRSATPAGDSDGTSTRARRGTESIPKLGLLASFRVLSGLNCCCKDHPLPGSQSRRRPAKPTDEANRCNLGHVTPKTLQKALYVEFSQIGQPPQVVWFGWSQFPIPEAHLAG